MSPLSFPPFHCAMIHQHAHSSVEERDKKEKKEKPCELGRCLLRVSATLWPVGVRPSQLKTTRHCLQFKEALKKQIKQTDAFYQDTKSHKPDKRPREESQNAGLCFIPAISSIYSQDVSHQRVQMKQTVCFSFLRAITGASKRAHYRQFLRAYFCETISACSYREVAFVGTGTLTDRVRQKNCRLLRPAVTRLICLEVAVPARQVLAPPPAEGSHGNGCQTKPPGLARLLL